MISRKIFVLPAFVLLAACGSKSIEGAYQSASGDTLTIKGDQMTDARGLVSPLRREGNKLFIKTAFGEIPADIDGDKISIMGGADGKVYIKK